MPVTWLIKKDSDSAQTLDAAGITDMVLSFQANGLDTCRFTVEDDYTADPSFPAKSRICVIRRTTVGEVVTDRCRFIGTVQQIPVSASDGSESITYLAKGPSFDLQRCDMGQQWAYTNSSGVASVGYQPIVVLGESENGTRIKSGATITAAITHAISRGVPVAYGTIAEGVYTPYDERSNVTVWDAIVSMLRYTPDYVLWWDYNVQIAGIYVPALMVTSPSSMSSVSKALHDADAESAEFTPRYDIQVPGILCAFRYTSEIEGKTVKTVSFQTAGDTDDPFRVALVYDLDGERRVYVEQEVEVEDYPSDLTGADAKTLFAQKIPWLAQLSSADWSIVECTRGGSKELPSFLKSGALCDWMQVEKESETFNVVVDYTFKDGSGNVIEKGRKALYWSALSTDAVSKKYRRLTEYEEPEPVPPTLATDLYASWSRLHFDGSVSLHEAEASLDILPGKILNLTGGRAEWASMNAIVQDAQINIMQGLTTVRTGTCGRLEADNLMAVYRAARGRRYSYLRLSRNDSESDNNGVPGASATPKDSPADGSPLIKRQRFRVADSDGTHTHVVDINPAAITFATSGNAAAQAIQLREMVMPYMDNGTLKAKLAQVLCGAGYAAEIPLGGARPSDPSSPTELGQNTEGSESALTTTYDATAVSAPGLKVWLISRVVFNESGDKKLYAYVRPLIFPSAIAPTVGAETRIEVDAPQ